MADLPHMCVCDGDGFVGGLTTDALDFLWVCLQVPQSRLQTSPHLIVLD